MKLLRANNKFWSTTRILIASGLAIATLSATGVLVAGAENGGPSAGVLAAGKDTSGAQPVLPPQLPSSDGFNPSSVPGATSTTWTDVSSSSSELWPGVVSSSTPAPFSATQLDLTGGLSQVWVPASAITQLGTLGAGLDLPVSLAYAEANPGPVEIDVEVLQFSSTNSPTLLFNSPFYSHLGPTWSGITLMSGIVPNGGRVTEIDSQANGGLSEYQFQWSDGQNWVQVSVLGANLTQAQAETVASGVTS